LDVRPTLAHYKNINNSNITNKLKLAAELSTTNSTSEADMAIVEEKLDDIISILNKNQNITLKSVEEVNFLKKKKIKPTNSTILNKKKKNAEKRNSKADGQ